jgi:hypothetical protein
MAEHCSIVDRRREVVGYYEGPSLDCSGGYLGELTAVMTVLSLYSCEVVVWSYYYCAAVSQGLAIARESTVRTGSGGFGYSGSGCGGVGEEGRSLFLASKDVVCLLAKGRDPSVLSLASLTDSKSFLSSSSGRPS